MIRKRETANCTHLLTSLRKVQERLGTPFEGPSDMESARAIAHSIKNQLFMQQIRQTMQDLGRTSGSNA